MSILWGQRHCLLSFNRLCSLIWIIFVHNFISLFCKFHLKSFYFLLQQVKINFNFVFITWRFDFCRCQIWFWLEDQNFWSIIQSRTFVSEQADIVSSAFSRELIFIDQLSSLQVWDLVLLCWYGWVCKQSASCLISLQSIKRSSNVSNDWPQTFVMLIFIGLFDTAEMLVKNCIHIVLALRVQKAVGEHDVN